MLCMRVCNMAYTIVCAAMWIWACASCRVVGMNEHNPRIADCGDMERELTSLGRRLKAARSQLAAVEAEIRSAIPQAKAFGLSDETIGRHTGLVRATIVKWRRMVQR